MREAYVQDTPKLMELVLARAKESKFADKLQDKIAVCEKRHK